MDKVENGLFVSVDYKGKLDDGEVFDTSYGRVPLEVEMGSGRLIKGFEDALMGMVLNEKKTFTLEPQDAYGMRNEDHVHAFERSELPAGVNPKAGEMIRLTTPDGQQIPALIAKVDDKQVIVDLNHPLAGKALTFEIEVVGISQTATQQHEGCGCDCNSDSKPDCSSGCC